MPGQGYTPTHPGIAPVPDGSERAREANHAVGTKSPKVRPGRRTLGPTNDQSRRIRDRHQPPRRTRVRGRSSPRGSRAQLRAPERCGGGTPARGARSPTAGLPLPSEPVLGRHAFEDSGITSRIAPRAAASCCDRRGTVRTLPRLAELEAFCKLFADGWDRSS